jgi:hypothetical protein
VFTVLGVLMYLGYQIDERRHQEIKRLLKERFDSGQPR